MRAEDSAAIHAYVIDRAWKAYKQTNCTKKQNINDFNFC